ncbi:MAG TPA: hypothetical protein DHW14_04335 [Clostridiales bacterium]|nr:hypothetical protein [Clostridiales bacterium]
MNGALLRADAPGGGRAFGPSSSALVLYGAVVEGFLVAGAWVLWRLFRGGSVFALIPPGPGSGPGAETCAGQVLLGTALAAVLAGTVLGLRAVWRGFREAVDPVARQLFGSANLTALVLVSLMAGFAEELFFRGYLLWRLQRAMGWWPALAVQAFLFGLFHVNYDLFPFDLWPMVGYVLMATAFGVLMGLLLRWSGSLLVPALVHPLSNLGVLWVGVTWEGFRGGWHTVPLYYLLQVAVGLAVIPLVLRAAASWSDRRARRAADRRRAREGWVEVRH